MNKRKLIVCIGLGVVLAAPAFAESSAELDALREEVAALRARLAALEGKVASAGPAKGVAQPATGARALAGSDGFRLTGEDDSFELRVGGLIQGQGRFFADGGNDGDSFLLRRARPILEGRVWEDFRFRLMPELANDVTLLDAYIDWTPCEEFALRVGKMKAPVGLERLQSPQHLLLVDRGLPTSLVPNRDIGAMIYGDLFRGVLRYEAGVFNGVPDGGSIASTDANQAKDVAARLFVTPFKNSRIGALEGLSFGVAGTAGQQRGPAPSYRTAGQATFFSYLPGSLLDGDQTRVSPQLFWSVGPAELLGEYVVSSQEVRNGLVRRSLDQSAWQVAAAWAITGERVTRSGIKVKRPTAAGGPGAFVLAARYGELDVDDEAFVAGLANPASAASKARSFGLALHWHPNTNVRWSIAYDHTTFDGGAWDGLRITDREAEEVITTQAQIAF